MKAEFLLFNVFNKFKSLNCISFYIKIVEFTLQVKAFTVALQHVTIDALEGVIERTLVIQETMLPAFHDS